MTLWCVANTARTPFAFTRSCAIAWGGSASPWNRPRPSWSNLVGSRSASKHGRNRPETIYFLGFTLYCTRNQKGNFKVGIRTEKTRLRRSLLSLQDLMRRIRHLTIPDQVGDLNAVLRGHYAYYGIAGNIRALQKVYRAVERTGVRCCAAVAGPAVT
jgi:hypothetical protein